MNSVEESKSSPKGFTLVELLVVICIIVTLMVILVPAVSGAHRRAQAAVCLGNARIIGQATLAMVADQGNFSGRSDVGYVDPAVCINQLLNYLVSKSSTRGWGGFPRCPLAQTNLVAGGYSFNLNLAAAFPTLSGIPAPLSRTILISEDNDAYMAGNAMYMEMTATMWGVYFNNFSYDAHYATLKALEGKSFTPQYHGEATNRGLNMFMVDGSAMMVKSGSNCNFYFAPTHAAVNNGVVGNDGYVWDQWYWITNRASYTYPSN
ncbi:MAG: prepilin-type N-terminal cleavage/methylation domain-containing protein [Chthoniobacterales bacterium]